MAANFCDRTTRVSEGDFVALLAVVYAFMEGEASAADKTEVASRAAGAGDRGINEIASRTDRDGSAMTHQFLSDAGMTCVPREMVQASGKPSKGDALAAAEAASEVRRVLDARTRLDAIYGALDAPTATVGAVAEELRSVAQELTATTGWQRVDPLEAYLEKERSDPGIQFFIPEIDHITMGCPPGRVATITAYTSQGKSTFALNMAYLNAMHHDVDGPFLTLETPASDVEMSFVVRHSLDPKWKGRPPLVNTPSLNAALSEEDKAFYREVAYDWVNGKHAQIKVCGMEHLGGKYTIGAVISLIKSFRPYKAVYIDYMNIFKTFEVPGTKGEFERINHAAAMIRNEICLDKVPVPLVQCAQIKRVGFERYVEEIAMSEKGGYRLSDLNEANEMEKGSSFVIALFLDERLRNASKVNVQLLKGRGSAIIDTPFEVGFAPQYFLVGESAEDYGHAAPGRAPANIDDLTKDVE